MHRNALTTRRALPVCDGLSPLSMQVRARTRLDNLAYGTIRPLWITRSIRAATSPPRGAWLSTPQRDVVHDVMAMPGRGKQCLSRILSMVGRDSAVPTTELRTRSRP